MKTIINCLYHPQSRFLTKYIMKQFCTYLTVYQGNLLPPFYIGSTSIERIKNGYRGTVASSKYKQLWRDENKHNPQLFRTYIISTHDFREEAADKESFLQKQLNVRFNHLYSNLAQWHGGHVKYGHKQTKETRDKISKTRIGKYKGRKQSPEHIKKRTHSRLKTYRYHSLETLAKIKKSKSQNPQKAWNKGIPMSDNLKENLSSKKIKYHYELLTPSNNIVLVENLPKFCKSNNFTKAQIANLRANFRNGINSKSNGYKILRRFKLGHT